ncbi:hypothetical protein [Sinimarinibacterium thermocellulolyticum]|uniref:Histidine kinase n=1 Tax=Sinimarinibacterium thermocellulolyticum TaxID=3170016 RepID=A0ABV2A9L5_9GAMM
MTAALVLVLIVILGLITIARQTPWTGLQLRGDGSGPGLVVERARGPAAQIPAGTRVDRIGCGRHWLPLEAADLTPEPDTRFVERADFDRFLQRQDALAKRLASTCVCIQSVDGQRWCLTPAPRRPLSTLPVTFWLQLLVGGAGALVGAGVWAFRRSDRAAAHVGLSGLALLASAGTAAVYSSRELALDGAWFRSLHLLNGACTLLFCAAFTATLWHYPQRLGRAPAGRLLLLVYGSIVALYAAGVLSDFDIALRLPVLAGFFLTAVFAALQWRRSRGRPLERAALTWFLLAWLGGGGTFLAVIFVPALLGHDAGAHQAYAFALFLIIYGGLALGVLRYRLFDLDRWWFTAWTVATGGPLFILIDLCILHWLGMAYEDAMLASLLIVSWLYLPLRTWLWQHSRGRRACLDSVLSVLGTANPASAGAVWRQAASALFTPLQIHELPTPPAQPTLSNDGATLLLPDVGGKAGLRLEFPDHGRRLFCNDDLRNARAAHRIVERMHAWRHAIEQGAQRERERIARALHDDVGAAVLDLLHRSSGPTQDLARHALAELRLVLQGLAAHGQRLDDILGWCRGDLREHADAADVTLHWHPVEPLPMASLEGHQALLLHRCLRELVTLAGEAQGTLSVQLTAANGRLCVEARLTPAVVAAELTLHALQQRAQGLDCALVVTYEPPHRLDLRLDLLLIEPTCD